MHLPVISLLSLLVLLLRGIVVIYSFRSTLISYVLSFIPTGIPTVFGQAIITTIAGSSTSGSYSGNDGQATSATFNGPFEVVLDSSGMNLTFPFLTTSNFFIIENVYISDSNNHVIRKLAVATSIITTYAGTGSSGYGSDYTFATSSALFAPHGMSFDSSNNLYIGDSQSGCVKMVDPTYNLIYKIACSLSYPCGIAVDSSNSFLYVAQYNAHIISKVIISTGVVTTIAGTGVTTYNGDGIAATSATMKYPTFIALDKSGNLFFNDGNNRIRKITATTNVVTTVAGSSTSASYSGDYGPATSAGLNSPTGIAIDEYGIIYISDSSSRVRMVNTSNIITTIAGGSSTGFSGDGGWGTSAKLSSPAGLRLDSSRNLFICDSSNQRIRKMQSSTPTCSPSVSPTYSPTENPTVIPSIPTNLPTTYVPSTQPPSFVPSSSPTAYVITTLAGTGTASFSGDGSVSTSATLNGPSGVAVDSSGE